MFRGPWISLLMPSLRCLARLPTSLPISYQNKSKRQFLRDLLSNRRSNVIIQITDPAEYFEIMWGQVYWACLIRFLNFTWWLHECEWNNHRSLQGHTDCYFFSTFVKVPQHWKTFTVNTCIKKVKRNPHCPPYVPQGLWYKDSFPILLTY